MIDLFSATWVDADHYELREDARRFENWESNYAAKLGLGSAMLAEIPGVSVHDIGNRKCGIVTFSVAGIAATEVEKRLRDNRIQVSVSSPVSTLIDATRRQLPDLVRSSVHYYNQESELDALVNCIKSISERRT
jgi:selenocysteine lyase/cysteine desulfurase